MSADLVFLDCETLGLHLDAPIWEFAAVRRFADGTTDGAEFRIQHETGDWLATLPDSFADDYRARYDSGDALDEQSAAIMVHLITKDAVVIGSNPSFDTARLELLLRRNGIEPAWHYRPVCVSTMAYGWLNGVAARAVDEARMEGEEPPPELVNREQRVPWSSDEVSASLGVDPANYPRHTALGDVAWCMAQWDVITGGAK